MAGIGDDLVIGHQGDDEEVAIGRDLARIGARVDEARRTQHRLVVEPQVAARIAADDIDGLVLVELLEQQIVVGEQQRQ